ncbi:hypothetical protein PR002_g25222 [Phytophthora rubi]|uniref:Uncharacterized protein n=1 Tax=Phytophthora rubi TaxID=129364 RepID=A0A6A3I4X0_9STRA|nr:hypothetical protein PR002_g25222 [Phytophthora rubi]
MIEPFDPVDASKRPQPQDQWFKIVALDDDLPAFNPLVMVKTVVLSPSSVKKFNQLALKFARVTEQSVICGIILRSATFALPAYLGRLVAPIAALMHLPGMIVFTAGFRTDWEWAPSCAVASLLLLVFTILTVDALTPTMKRRLHFKFWMPVVGIILFWLVEVVLLVDVLVVGNWDLQDRVFLKLIIFGRQAQFRVVPFFLSRILTIFVWSARYVNIALSRQNDNVLILLRGEVEFDYEGWKRQSRLGPGAKQTRQFCT